MIKSQNHGGGTPPDSSTSFLEAAIFWFIFGFNVIPIKPNTKITAVKWDQWLKDLSIEKITEYWTRNPDHEVGFIPGDGKIVLDADSHEAYVPLYETGKVFDCLPNLVIKTTKGAHYYYRRAKGTFAKSDSHSTEKFPDRIDVKTGRALVILPPSMGKEISLYQADNANDLMEIGQDMIDAIFMHNGRPIPRPQEIVPSPHISTETQTKIVVKLKALLEHLDPDCGYEDWLQILMAIYHETGGSEEGFELADKWSSKGKKYKGRREIRVKWDSFKPGTANPITMGTLNKMLEAKGIDWIEICSEAEESFEPCDYKVVDSDIDVPVESKITRNPLDEYTLTGRSSEIEKNTVDASPLLGKIALMGQSNVYYSPPNTGKTLIILYLLIKAINDGRVDPSKVYYLNMDDTGKGLLEKLQIAEEYGFHMLAGGYLEFTANKFLSIMLELVENDQACGVVIILDTLKKFVNLMDKGNASRFTDIIRQFVSKGGTVIALAHTNKNLGSNGKLVYGGTSDIVDDLDCAYTLATISKEDGEKVVEFENIKYRGNVVATAAYRYSTDPTLSYGEILLSVAPVDPLQLEPLKQAKQQRSDAEIVDKVIACISEGINTKMKLADAVAARAGVSRRIANKIIEKYTGDDPSLHRWKFNVADRGAKVFVLLESISPQQPEP